MWSDTSDALAASVSTGASGAGMCLGVFRCALFPALPAAGVEIRVHDELFPQRDPAAAPHLLAHTDDD